MYRKLLAQLKPHNNNQPDMNNTTLSSDYLSDRTTNLIVSAFIRKSEKLLFYSLINYIPSDIKSITLSYVGNHFMSYRSSYQWQIEHPKTIESSQFKISNIKWSINFTPNNCINLNVLSMDSIPSHWKRISMRISLQCYEINQQLIETKDFTNVQNLNDKSIMKLPLNNIQNINTSKLTIIVSITILRITGINNGEYAIFHQQYETGNYWLEDLLIATPRKTKVSFIEQLKLCCFTFNFKQQFDKIHETAQQNKHKYLMELVQYISSKENTKQCFSDESIPVILNMLATNLFRSLPPKHEQFDAEQDEPNFDPAWRHLQVVYEFFHCFVLKAQVRTIRRNIHKQFLLNMMNLFQSEDPRERDFLKLILHCLYGRCMPFRSFIRKAICNVLYVSIYSGLEQFGISELLEIFGSIITGFKVPLKNEHKLFFQNVLIPMYKVSFLSQFHDELLNCILQFIQKDQSLVLFVIAGLLKFWPVISSKKELLFLNQLGHILDFATQQQLATIIDPLFHRLAKCICSMNFQVAERVLFLWNNNNVATFTTDYRKRILPIIYPSLKKNSKHWSSSVKSLSLAIINKFKEIDNKLYEKVDKYYT